MKPQQPGPVIGVQGAKSSKRSLKDECRTEQEAFIFERLFLYNQLSICIQRGGEKHEYTRET